MRIKHTHQPYEAYYLYFLMPWKGKLFENNKHWIFYKSYASKQGALNAMNRLKKSDKFYPNEYDLIFKIVWSPSPYAGDDRWVTVYSDEKRVN